MKVVIGLRLKGDMQEGAAILLHENTHKTLIISSNTASNISGVRRPVFVL